MNFGSVPRAFSYIYMIIGRIAGGCTGVVPRVPGDLMKEKELASSSPTTSLYILVWADAPRLGAPLRD